MQRFPLVLAGMVACSEPAPPAAPTTAEFVSDAECADCHSREFERWRGSHHDLAMQAATPETVLGDFDHAEFEHLGERTTFRREGERFIVNAVGPDGARADFDVAYVFGVHPLQQLLVELDGGRLQALSVAWDSVDERWFTLYPDERIRPDDPLHWSGRYLRWNSMCAACHSTGLEKHHDVATDTYQTTWHELDVGCQACHGPGGEHLRWAAAAANGADYELGNHGLTTRFELERQEGQLDACAPCHSRRSELTLAAPPGAPFLDHYLPERLHAGYYFADGQIEDEVYVYGSFVQSKMGMAGVTCTDCHDAHSLGLVAEGNAVCMKCHRSAPPTDRFPDLVSKDYDTPEHHHHEPGSDGAMCVNCHMPERTYMVVDPRRDHSFRIPRPDLGALLGTPDACSGCHVEEGAGWAAERVREWYGEERAPHFAPVFALGRVGHPDALQPLAGIASDAADTPGLVRATAIELLEQQGDQALQVAVPLLEDPDPLVRFSVVGLLDGLPAQAKIALLLPAASDPVRMVRIEAARALASVPPGDLPVESRAVLDAAFAEFEQAQAAQSDFPSAHLNLGVYFTARGDELRAIEEYETALRLDERFLPARFNLANLLNRRGENEKVEPLIRRGLELYPDEAELHFSLALLLAELDRKHEAADSMTIVARLAPGRARVHYNLGLLLKDVGRVKEAEVALQTAIEQDPRDPDPVHALALLYADRGEWQTALPYAETLVRLRRGDSVSRELYERVRAGL